MTTSNTAAVLNRPLSNTNILAEKTLISPDELRTRYPRSEKASQTVEAGRASVEAILDGHDKRLLAVGARHRVTSIADFISARFGKRQSLRSSSVKLLQ